MLVPITLPYLIFVPYPKVFFDNPTEKWSVPISNKIQRQVN